MRKSNKFRKLSGYIASMVFLGLSAGCDRALESTNHVQVESGRPVSGRVSLTGNDAAIFMDALASSGVQDTDHRLGAITLKVSSVDCQIVVAPGMLPSCSVKLLGGETLVPTGAAANDLYQVLLKSGARVFTGRLGVVAVAADAVSCVRPVVPQPHSSCRFLVNVRN